MNKTYVTLMKQFKLQHGFNNFITTLGERILLKDWKKFRGGLDVRGNMTGAESVYTTHEEHEIMFHVSTMLPFSADDRQQVLKCILLVAVK